MTCHSRELALPIMIDVWSLCCLLPVWPLISTLVRRAAHRGGVGHDDPLTIPRHGIISGQAPSVALSWSADMRSTWGHPCRYLPCQWGPHGEKGRPDNPKGLPLPLIFLFSPICNPCSPLAYKRESREPIKGHQFTTSCITLHHNRTTSIEPQTHS